ncbi:MAG: hypothetical protein MSA68_07220 [Helicobacter sp.]|nr:hypothetical protein [Helicobacter sp.]
MYRLDYFANFPINKKAQMLLSQDFPNANPFSLQDSQNQKNAKQQITKLLHCEKVEFFNCTQEGFLALFLYLGCENIAILPSFCHQAYKGYQAAMSICQSYSDTKPILLEFAEIASLQALHAKDRKILFIPAINEDILSYNDLNVALSFLESCKDSLLFIEISSLLQNGDFESVKKLRHDRVLFVLDFARLGLSKGHGLIAHSYESFHLQTPTPNAFFDASLLCLQNLADNKTLKEYCAHRQNAFLFQTLQESLKDFKPDVFVPLDSCPNNALALRLFGIKAGVLAQSLLIEKICVINGQDCMLGNFMPSYVLESMGYEESQRRELLSISFRNLSHNQLHAIAQKIAYVYKTLRKLDI